MSRNCNRAIVALVLTVVMLSGCAVYSLPSTMDQLQAGGYKGTRAITTTATGERQESPYYEIWWKEFRQQGRICHYCFVPGPRIVGGGYNWKIAVFVDDRQVWEWQSGALQGKPAVQSGISCAETPQLPEGRVTWRVWYTYWS